MEGYDKDVQLVKRVLNNILSDDEKVLSISKSRNKRTMYVTLARTSDGRFMHFRLSNHRVKNSYYSNKTFYILKFHDIVLITQSIREFLDRTDWYVFKYEMYYMINVLKLYNDRHHQIMIENAYKVFEDHIGKVVFYAERYTGKGTEVESLDSRVEDVLRQALAQGLVDYYPRKSGYSVYATSASMALVKYYEVDYQQRYQVDTYLFQVEGIQLPVEEKTLEETSLQLPLPDVKGWFVYVIVNETMNQFIELGTADESSFNQHVLNEDLLKHLKYLSAKNHRLNTIILKEGLNEKDASLIEESLRGFISLFNGQLTLSSLKDYIK